MNKVSQYVQQPMNTNWATVKHILRYLKGIVNHGLYFALEQPCVLLTGEVMWMTDGRPLGIMCALCPIRLLGALGNRRLYLVRSQSKI